MVRTMGNRHFGSKATSGLCQPLIAMMPPHAVYVETHLGGGAIMKRKPAAACGKAYAANGADESSLLEIEVRAHRRVIRRGRWRRRCGCASSPLEVSAPAVPRLFPNTPYGTSVWSRLLFEHYACLRPLHRVAAWLGDQGLPVAPGTLADSAPRFVPLFQPLGEAIRAQQNASALRHADETTWRVQALRAEGRSARAWLWTSVGNDAVYFHIDPSRGGPEETRNRSAALRPRTRCAVHQQPRRTRPPHGQGQAEGLRLLPNNQTRRRLLPHLQLPAVARLPQLDPIFNQFRWILTGRGRVSGCFHGRGRRGNGCSADLAP